MKQNSLNRRDMLKALGLLGASTALTACGPTGVPLPTAAPAAAVAPAAAAAGGKKI